MSDSWRRYKVGDLVKGHYSGPSPTCEERNVCSEREWGLLKTTAITWDGGWDWTRHKVPPRQYWNQPAIEVQPGDVIVTKAGPRHRVGVVVHVDATPPRIMVSGKMVGLRPDDGIVLPAVLAGVLATAEPQKFLDHRTTGMAESQVNFSNSVLLQTPLKLPPLPEQRRIAEVLDTLDEAIRKTEQVIAKLQQMKQGLLHDLLTRGIDENGELRDPERHPEQFKDSPLGRIPRGWKIDRLLDRVELPSGQLDPRREPYRSWVLVAPDHIESGTGRLLGKATAAEQGAISGKYGFRPGDVVYSKIRPYLRKAILADFEGLCSADMYPLRPSAGDEPRFILALILGEHFSRFAEIVSMRSGFPKINREELSEYRGAFPLIHEQAAIASLLNSMDETDASERSNLEKLRTLKHGLMDDLLTGRVRITVPEGAAA